MDPSTTRPVEFPRPGRPEVFALPDRLAGKRDPDLIGDDRRHLIRMAQALERDIADLTERLDAQRQAPGLHSSQAVERDIAIHRLTARLRAVRRHELDSCLGRMVFADGRDPVYVGRMSLTDEQGRRLLVDWRSPRPDPSSQPRTATRWA